MKKNAFFVILFAGLAACTEGFPHPTLTPVSPPLAFTFTPSSMQSEKISEPDLLSISLFDEEHGWGVMENKIGRTIDGGVSWYSVMPENFDANGYITSTYFLDQNLAWFLWSDSNPDLQNGILFHTKDGGLTWDFNETPFNGGLIRFLDEHNGWTMVSLGAGVGSEAIAVYLSGDGGVSWEQVFTNDPTRQGSRDSVPMGGIKGGLVPLDKDIAFIWGVYYAPGSVYLYRTDDGGWNWKLVSLTLPSYAQEEDLAVDQMQFFDEQAGYLVIRILSRNMEGLLYITHDGGDTWELSPQSVAPCRTLDFISISDGITYCNETFFLTINEAKTWTPIHPNAVFREALVSMDFVSKDVGWVITRDAADRKGFYKTIDGGLTWSVIFGPPISDFGPSLEQIWNAPYRLGARDDHATVLLKNGAYENGTDPASPDYASVSVVPHLFASGDLDHDGARDGTVVTVENYGGKGNFSYLTVYRAEDGLPIWHSSAFIDDRALINWLEIEDNKIFMVAVIHGPGDPGCCPNFRVQQTYGLTKSRLILQRLVSWTPSGVERSITIQEPVNESKISSAVEVKGKFTISPFENKLAYRIFDAASKELAAGAISVQAQMGEPGVFDAVLDLSSIPTSQIVRLEIQDLSGADGSLLAMDSVELVVQ